MKIPGIYVTIRGDVTQLNADLGVARKMVKESANEISDAMGNALNPNQITSGINKITGRFTELSNYSKVAGKDLTGLGVSLGEVGKMTGLAADQFAKMQSRFLEVQSVKTAEKALKDVGAALKLDAQEILNLGVQFNLSEASISSVAKSLGVTEQASRSLASAMKNLSDAQQTVKPMSGKFDLGLDGLEKQMVQAFRVLDAKAAVAAEQTAISISKAFNAGLVKLKFGFMGEDIKVTSKFDLGLDGLEKQIDTTFSRLGARAELDAKKAASTASQQTKLIFTAIAAAEADASKGVLEYEATVKRSMSGVESKLRQLAQVYKVPQEQIDVLRAKAQQQIELKIKTDTLGQLAKDAGLATREIKSLERELGVTVAKSAEVQSRFKELGAIIKNTFLYGSAYQLLGIVQQMPGALLEATAKMEGLRKSFEGIFGAQSGAQQFEYVMDTANRYGKTIDAVAGSYRKFAAAADYVGMTTSTTRRVFEAVTQAITKVGGSTQDVEGSLTALQQMISKGTVSSEEFRLQFAERIPGAMKMGADALGVTTAEFKRMLEQGAVVATDFIPKLADQLAKFSQGWEATADTMEANTARLKNAMLQLADSKYIQQWASDVLKGLSDITKGADDFFSTIGRAMKGKELYSQGFLSFGEYATMSKAEMKAFVEQFDEATNTVEKKMQVYQAKMTELRAADQTTHSGRIININNEEIANLQVVIDGLQKLKDADAARKAIDTLGLSLHQMALGAAGDMDAVSTKVINLQNYLYNLTNGQWYELKINTTSVDSALDKITSLYSKTSAYQYDTAMKTADEAIRLSAEAQKGLAERRDQYATSTSPEHRQQLSQDIALYETAVRNAEQVRLDAEEKARSAAVSSQKFALQTTNPYSRFSPGDFNDLGMKDKVRSAQYQEKLVQGGYWLDVYSPDQETIKRARELEKVAYQQYLDGVKKDRESANKKGETGALRANAADGLTTSLRDQGAALAASLNGDEIGKKLAEIQKKFDETAKKIKDAKIKGQDMVDASWWAEYDKGMSQYLVFAQQIDKLFPGEKQMDTVRSLQSHFDGLSQAAGAAGLDIGLVKGALDTLKDNALLAQLETTRKYTQDIGVYYAASMDQISLKSKDGGQAEKAVWDSVFKDYQENCGEMVSARTEAYDKIIQQAQAAGNKELAAFAYLGKDELNKKWLETRLKSEDSFASYLADKLALQYGLYKSAYGQQLEEWQKTADAMLTSLEGIQSAVSVAFGAGLTDLVTGKFKTLQDYVDSALSGLKQVFIRFLTDMAQIAARRYIIVPIMGQIMGTAGSFSAGSAGASGTGAEGEGGFGLGDVTKYGGYAKDAYNMIGGAGSLNALSSTSTNAFMGSLNSGGSIQMANVSASNATAASSGGAMSALGAGAAAGGIGYMAGNLVRPDVPGIGYAAGATGLAVGTTLASSTAMGAMGMGALSGLAATGYGAIAALVIAGIMAATTPNTVKSEWTVPNASKSAIMIAGGENTNAAYGVIKQTSSGAFGSSSTSHKSIFGIASPEMAKQQDAAWAAATKGLDGFTKAVGVSESELTKAKSSFNFGAIPIPDGMEAEVYRNVANAEAEHTLTQLGMLDAIKAVTKDGEAYIDTLTRLDSTFSTMENLAISTGFGLEQVAGGLDRIVAADYASRLMEAAGGADAFAGALARLNTYGYSAQEQMERSLTGTATATGRAIAEVGDATVTIENFWPRFRQAMESGMDPDRMAAWVTASARMEQWEQVKAAWQQRDIEALRQQTSTLQAQISVIQQVSSAWKGFGDQMVRLKQSLLMDANLSTLSPLEKMGAAKSRLDSLTAEANNKSTAHLADIDQATKDYLTSAMDYYGASADYFAIFDSTSATIDQLQALAGSQVSAADQQIAQLNMTIEQNNAQITALNTINSGLGEVVNAVNNVSSAIGGAIQSANAAQQSVSIPQWAASAVAADTAAAASPYAAASGQLEGQANYLAVLESMGWSVPAFAEGGTTKGGWFVAGDDPLSSRSGELMYSASPVRVVNNKQSKALLSGGQGGGDTSALEAKLDAIGAVLVDILSANLDGNETRERVRATLKGVIFKGQGA